jgi:hypothetical protein
VTQRSAPATASNNSSSGWRRGSIGVAKRQLHQARPVGTFEPVVCDQGWRGLSALNLGGQLVDPAQHHSRGHLPQVEGEARLWCRLRRRLDSFL